MRRIPSKVKKVIQATTNSYLSIMAHAYMHFNLGRVVADHQLHVSVIFFFSGNTKGSFGNSLSVLALRIFICVFFFSPMIHHLMFDQKKFTSDAYGNTFPPLHSDLPMLLTGSPPNRRKK
jgi:hypothetical protein